MKKLILLSLLLTACSPKEKGDFYCLTILGPMKFSAEDKGVKHVGSRFLLENEQGIISIPDSACVNVQEK